MASLSRLTASVFSLDSYRLEEKVGAFPRSNEFAIAGVGGLWYDGAGLPDVKDMAGDPSKTETSMAVDDACSVPSQIDVEDISPGWANAGRRLWLLALQGPAASDVGAHIERGSLFWVWIMDSIQAIRSSNEACRVLSTFLRPRRDVG